MSKIATLCWAVALGGFAWALVFWLAASAPRGRVYEPGETVCEEVRRDARTGRAVHVEPCTSAPPSAPPAHPRPTATR